MDNINLLKVYPTSEELSSICSRVECPQPSCDAFFQSTSNLNMHLIKHHKVANNGLTKKKATQYFCPEKLCQYSKDSTKYFTKLKYLKQHFLKVHALKKFVCTKCEKKFSTEAFKLSHMKICGKLFTCTCGSKYTSTEAILTHCKRKGHGHLFVEKVHPNLMIQENNVCQANGSKSKSSGRFIYPKLSCEMAFPIHYIAAIALSELSAPCNLSKVVDKGVQTDAIQNSFAKHYKINPGIQILDKKRKSSQQTQTINRIKKLKISAQTQTNSDFLKQKNKSNLKPVLKKRKKSMETQTKDIFKGDNNINLNVTVELCESNEKYNKKNNELILLKDKSDFLNGVEQITENQIISKRNEKWLWDNNFFTSEHNPGVSKEIECKNEIFTLNQNLNISNKEVNLNEYNHLPQKTIPIQYTSEQGSDTQIFDINKLCNIETQTEIENFLTEYNDNTFTLCSSTETQTTDDFDSLLYSNMCTQTCEEVDELFNFNFVHIETQTTWPDLTDLN